MTTTTSDLSHEALDLLAQLPQWVQPLARNNLRLALAAERRATVERIERAYLASEVPDSSEEFYKGIDAASANLRRILDEEAARSPEEGSKR